MPRKVWFRWLVNVFIVANLAVIAVFGTEIESLSPLRTLSKDVYGKFGLNVRWNMFDHPAPWQTYISFEIGLKDGSTVVWSEFEPEKIDLTGPLDLTRAHKWAQSVWIKDPEFVTRDAARFLGNRFSTAENPALKVAMIYQFELISPPPGRPAIPYPHSSMRRVEWTYDLAEGRKQ